jgi:hypothetical protein
VGAEKRENETWNRFRLRKKLQETIRVIVEPSATLKILDTPIKKWAISSQHHLPAGEEMES